MSDRDDATSSTDDATLEERRDKVSNFVKREAVFIKKKLPKKKSDEEVWSELQRRVRSLFPKFDLVFRMWNQVKFCLIVDILTIQYVLPYFLPLLL
jgi:hypothetical protein